MIRLKQLIIEDTISFPIIVSDTYTSPIGNCDRLHAFNDTHGVTVGGMNNKVNPKLLEVYNAGYNPDITDVKIEITNNKTEYSVKWTVTINESTDGNAYTGLYSRGGGAPASKLPKAYPKYLSDMNGAHHTSIEQVKKSSAIRKRGTIDKISTVYVKEHYPDKDCNIKQFFYKYSLKEYPPKSKTTNNNKSNKSLEIKNYQNTATPADATRVDKRYFGRY